MKILLVHPPTSSHHPEPPLGLGYLGAVLKSKGHEVRIVDMEPLGIDFPELPDAVREYSPRLVGVSFMTSQYSYAMKCFAAARAGAPGAATVAGGFHVTALPADVMKNPDIDFVVVGEGENTLAELVGSLDAGPSVWRNIPGLVFRDGDDTVINSPRDLIEDLDSIPMPLWEELGRARYTDIPTGLGKEVEVFPLITGRGCPNDCIFCAANIVFRRRLRARSPENVFKEMEALHDRFGARHFNILDDTLTIRKADVTHLCEMIVDARWDIEWRCTARVDTVDLELLKTMKRAGCRMVSYGVESGDPEILGNIRKRIDLGKVKEAFRLTRQAGLQSMGLFMVGNLGETWASVRKTIDFIKELDADFVSCSILIPYPGTEIYTIAKERGWLRVEDWDKYVPTPHAIRDFRPVAVTEHMGQDELLAAYYSVVRSFSRDKMRRSYGNLYFLNPFFYKKEVWNRISAGGIRQYLSLLRRVV